MPVLIKGRTRLGSGAIIKNQKQSPAEFNHGIKSNFLQSPPLADEKLRFPDVYQNPFVIQVAEGYLGSDLQMPFITANVYAFFPSPSCARELF